MNDYPILKYTLAGFLVGLWFLLVGWNIAYNSSELPLSLASILEIHRINHTVFLVDTIPVVLALVFSFLGKAYTKRGNSFRLSAEESVLKSLLEMMADGFIIFNEEGTIQSSNPAAEKMFGYSEREMNGKSVARIIPASYAMHHDLFIVSGKANSPSSMSGVAGREVEGKRKNGNAFVLSITVSEIYIEGKRRFSSVMRDVTEVKRAQAEVLRTAGEWAQFVDRTNAPIFGIDSGGLVNMWNQTAEKITGFTKAEVLGQDLVAEFITDEYKAPVGRVLDNALDGKETANYEFPLYSKKKQRVDLLLNATPRRDVDGRITGVIGVGQDITELKQKERALNQARKMETVGQLTGGIAHDFNNLLSIIGGNLRFLMQEIGEVNKETKELFEDAMSATNDGADLTARLLAFSRNRRLKPELKEVNETIENVSRFLSRTLGESIDLSTELSKDQFYVNVDTSQLENALLNLAINSRDAMPGGGNITIRAERYCHSVHPNDYRKGDSKGFNLGPGNYIVISVEDTGVGIKDDHLGRVYEPFFTTKDVGKGSGLGLSMVYGFVQQSNGQCIIRSNYGQGTTVSMYFPEAENFEGIRCGDVDREIALLGTEVILVVEDDPRVRRVTLRDLRKLGYQTLEADNAEMAKKIVDSEEKIDLVFTDVLMPGEVDGQMLGIWVEANHPQIKVVLTSGFTKRKTDVEGNGSSFPIIRKPYTIETLGKQMKMTLWGKVLSISDSGGG